MKIKRSKQNPIFVDEKQKHYQPTNRTSNTPPLFIIYEYTCSATKYAALYKFYIKNIK